MVTAAIIAAHMLLIRSSAAAVAVVDTATVQLLIERAVVPEMHAMRRNIRPKVQLSDRRSDVYSDILYPRQRTISVCVSANEITANIVNGFSSNFHFTRSIDTGQGQNG